MAKPALPKDVKMMVEKNNMVMAIKTLASDRGISMDEAKILIDEYEETLIVDRDKKVAKIAKKQGVRLDDPTISPSSTTNQNNTADNLTNSLSNHLNDIGYKKPLLPYWVKRVVVILLVMAVVFYMLWRLFG